METPRTSIILGCDHAAYPLKETVRLHLTEKHHVSVEDIGTYTTESVDYPDFGNRVAEAVSQNRCERGILLCGTGIGMSMVANKFDNVRAALCNDLFSAIMARRHNDANILVMGGRIIGPGLALEIVDAWLKTAFEGGRHQYRLDKFIHPGRMG